MGQVVSAIPRIYDALEDLKAYHQSTMVEVEGKISKQSINILIDLGSTHDFISPKVVEICAFNKTKNNKSWLVQLATGTR